MPNKYKIKRTYAEFLNRTVRPNLLFTPSIKNHFKADHPTNGNSYWIRVDRDQAAKELNNFIISLSKAVYGIKNWGRYKRKLASAFSIEGGIPYERMHPHVLLNKPGFISLNDFKETISSVWRQNNIYLSDFNFKNLDDGDGSLGGTIYCGKYGPRNLALEYLNPIRE